MEFTINYWAVLLAGIASIGIGILWYGFLFGSAWVRLMGFSEERMAELKRRGMARMYTVNFLSTLVMAFVLAHFVQLWKPIDIFGAFQLAFWTWLGFIATTMLAPVLWEGKLVRLYILNTSYQLVSLLVMAVILTLWK